jgi:hypothetical protein
MNKFSGRSKIKLEDLDVETKEEVRGLTRKKEICPRCYANLESIDMGWAILYLCDGFNDKSCTYRKLVKKNRKIK